MFIVFGLDLSECILNENTELNDFVVVTKPENKPTPTKERKSQSLSIDEDLLVIKERPVTQKLTRRANSNSILTTITTFFSEKLLFKNLSSENLGEKKSNFIDYYNNILNTNKALPKEFQIRQFPMSSCVNTFTGDSSNHLLNEIDTKIPTNYSLRRYYHVFKAYELDSLINETCDDLFIYKSFYDHGNWCVCGEKK